VAHPTLAPWIADLGAELREARATASPIRPPSARIRGFTVDRAWEVQQYLVAEALADGRRRVGHTVGRTAAAANGHPGGPQPAFGVLLDDMIVESGGVVDCSTLISPRVMAGLALVLQRGLSGPDVSIEEVIEAVGFAVAALQVVDSRIANWEVSVADAVADNACGAVVVVNDVPSILTPRELAADEVTVSCDGQAVATGHGAALVGDPLRLLQWLTRRLASYGDGLRAGELVLLGTVHASLPLDPGRHYRAVYRSGLSVEFTTGGRGPQPVSALPRPGR